MTIVQVIDGRERDLGGFVVRRVLPFGARPMVGPFIFFDHLGPAVFGPGEGIDVRPHPHIGLATVTYLFSGALEHRDSLGNVREITPGDVNWMTAGSGITHSERTPLAGRAAGPSIHAIQTWVALPDGHEDVEPAFVHHAADTLPKIRIGTVDVTLIAGQAFGQESPVATLWPTLYVEALLPTGSSLEVPKGYEERALYVVEGNIVVADTELRAGCMAVLEPEPEPVTLRALDEARVMLLGGARFPTPRQLSWNFVASTSSRIEAARDRWRRQQFPRVPGDLEFIPLPA